jgi:hypothetical protein
LVIRTQKKKNLTEEEQARSEADAQFAAQRGDRWTFVAVLPRSSFVYAIHHNKRTVVEAERFIKKIKQRTSSSFFIGRLVLRRSFVQYLLQI